MLSNIQRSWKIINLFWTNVECKFAVFQMKISTWKMKIWGDVFVINAITVTLTEVWSFIIISKVISRASEFSRFRKQRENCEFWKSPWNSIIEINCLVFQLMAFYKLFEQKQVFVKKINVQLIFHVTTFT